jgi:hypothetical protein
MPSNTLFLKNPDAGQCGSLLFEVREPGSCTDRCTGRSSMDDRNNF